MDLEKDIERQGKEMCTLNVQIRALKDERRLNQRTIWTLQEHEKAWGEKIGEGMGKLEFEKVLGKMSLETKRLTISNYKRYHGCKQCGYSECPWALQLHHTDPDRKEFTVSHALQSHPWDEVVEETRKCVVYCSRCHTEWHYAQHISGLLKQCRKLNVGPWTEEEKIQIMESIPTREGW